MESKFDRGQIMNSKQQTEVREQISLSVMRGASPRAYIVEDTLDYFIDENFDLDEEIVSRMVDEEIVRHFKEQASWEGATDCDLLDRAFANLEADGIVARQDFTCCGNCGTAEIGDDVDDISAKAGYVFYHSQDTDSAIEGRGLYFNYGAFDDDEEKSVEVGKRVVTALQQAGLQPQWDEQLNRRIYLPMDWKKRR